MSEIGKRIRLYRGRKGLSIAELARKLEIAPSTLREWEQGRQIRGEPYVQIAEHLGVTLADLLVGNVGGSSVAKDLDEMEQIIKRIRTKL